LYPLRGRRARKWRGPDAAAVETFSILTTTANDRVRACHDRMPVLVAPPDFATWLDAARPLAEVERLLAPASAASLTATPVCGWVNDVRFEGARFLEGLRGLADDELGSIGSSRKMITRQICLRDLSLRWLPAEPLLRRPEQLNVMASGGETRRLLGDQRGKASSRSGDAARSSN
jgi:hypothetical protein